MGLIIVLSFISTSFFRWTRVPSSLLLIFVGIFLSFWQAFDHATLLRTIAPIFGAFALLLILLEAGLELDIRLFIKSIGPALLFGILTYLISAVSIIWLLQEYFEYNLATAILLALISVGGSPAILIPIIRGMRIEKQNKAFLDLECTITEILGLILTISLIPLLVPSLLPTTPEFYLKGLVYTGSYKLLMVFLGALFVPVILGMIWSRVLSYAGDKPLWPMLTIGVALLIYGLTELLGGKGALNILIFAIVIGNARFIRVSLTKLMTKLQLSGAGIKKFLSFFVGEHFAQVRHVSLELSFLVRTFFFVYLGIIVDFSDFNFRVFLIVGLITFFPMIVRFIFAKIGNFIPKFNLPAPNLLTFLLPRGLANALAAFAIIAYAIKVQLPDDISFPLDQTIIAPVFGVIILSNIILPFFLFFRKETECLEEKVETLG